MAENESLPGMGWEQRIVADCFERAEYLEELINQAVDTDTVRELYAEIMPEIEKTYPYYGQPVHVSGFGLHPIFDEDQTAILDESWQHSNGDTGIHCGFNVIHDEDDEVRPYRIMHKIQIGEARNTPLATIETESRVFKYFSLDSPLVPIIELEAALSTYEFSDLAPNDRLDIVSEYSKDFVNMLRSTVFRRMQHKRQRRVVDDFLIEAENRASIRDLQFIGELQYAYVPSLTGNKKSFIPLSLDDVIVNGTCLGVDTVETTKLSEKAIRKDADMGDKWCGLCIVIDPDSDTRDGLALTDGQVMYIPTYDQAYNIELYESTN